MAEAGTSGNHHAGLKRSMSCKHARTLENPYSVRACGMWQRDPCLCAGVEALLRLDLWVCPPPRHAALHARECDVEEHADRAVVNLGHKQADEPGALLSVGSGLPETASRGPGAPAG